METTAGDLDLYVWGPDGKLVALSVYPLLLTEDVTFIPTQTGTYQIEVLAFRAGSRGTFIPPGNAKLAIPRVGGVRASADAQSAPSVPTTLGPPDFTWFPPSPIAEFGSSSPIFYEYVPVVVLGSGIGW